MRGARTVGLVAAALAAIACGGKSSSAPWTLEASGGTYNDGSGRLGVAVLATLRDSDGAGPQSPWTGALSDASGLLTALRYDAPGVGSYSVLWWPAVAPAQASFALSLAPDGESGYRASFTIPVGAPIEIPTISLSPDGSTLSWPPIAGVATYECRVSSGGALQRSVLGPGTTCTVGDLPAGAYEASVLAYSADLASVGASAAQEPALPARFDVSEARLAFSNPAPGAPAFHAVAAGGAIDYSSGTPGLAVWISVANADGTAPTVAWTIDIVGPGLPPSAPLTVTYGANLPRLLFWSYDVPATPGVYSFTATSTAGALAGTFTVGTPASLDIPQGVTATAGPQGSATVDWSAVPVARSFLVSAYDHVAGAFVASEWVSVAPAKFPQGSFASGSIYDVYVDATDADMLGGAAPTQVAISENTFQPATFVAE